MDRVLRREADGQPSDLPERSEGADAADDGAIGLGKRAWSQAHAVNLRVSLPTPFGRIYFTFVAGRERRSAARRVQERRKHPLITFGNLCFLAALSTIAGLAVHGALQLAVLQVLEETGALVLS